LLIPHLGGGGAERVTGLLATSLSAQKYELHLGLVTQAEAGSHLPCSVKVHALGAPRVRAGAFRLVKLVRRLKPDLILSGMAHLNFLVLLSRPLFPPATRVLVRQNGTVSAMLASGDLPGYTRLLFRMLYRYADRIICQTAAMANDLSAELGIPKARLAVLPNPVDLDGIRSAIALDPVLWAGSGPHLLAVGRLSREKGFDLLLQALAAVRGRFPSTDLVIAGAGPEEKALRTQCRELGLEANVRFTGHIPHPGSYFPGASAFVLSSRHEGLPNSLLEAAAAGLPLVAVPASPGVADLLRHQPGVWLAPEISSGALADALLEVLQSLRPSQRFPHAFIHQFSLARAIRAYEALFDSALGNGDFHSCE
jgi:glycosyltransferase involved in cell wall biosynthesis